MRLLFHILAALACLITSSAAHAQGRGGMPRDIPMPRPMPDRGIPDRVSDRIADRVDNRSGGLDRANIASEYRLPKPQGERATAMARAAPADYELDRMGALVIRGEILAMGVDEAALRKIQRAGFVILRQTELPELGVNLLVLARDNLPGPKAVEHLRKIAPHASYELNHVFFESGGAAAVVTASEPPTSSASAGSTMVGRIDTGVARSVDAAANVRVIRRNFTSDASGGKLHGTAVASLLTRKPGKVTIYAADIFGDGPRGGTAELLAKALDWMAQQRVPVVNISMVGPPNGLVATAANAMLRKGHIIVAPVGNDGSVARPLFPASYPGVIAVSAAGSDGRLLPEASRVRRVDFVGPGVATVRDPHGKAVIVRGTSYAAPIISRLLADRIAVPNAAEAKKSVEHLARAAAQPKTKRHLFGRGLIGVSASQ
jgi:hypothetical protein